jgi:hypothetical protein
VNAEASTTDGVVTVEQERGELTGVAVVIDDDRRLRREERIEARLVESVRMFARCS